VSGRTTCGKCGKGLWALTDGRSLCWGCEMDETRSIAAMSPDTWSAWSALEAEITRLRDVIAGMETRRVMELAAKDEAIGELLGLLPREDDPAGCPAGHGSQCCRNHAACRAALADGDPFEPAPRGKQRYRGVR
jgi:hypothetical protein